ALPDATLRLAWKGSFTNTGKLFGTATLPAVANTGGRMPATRLQGIGVLGSIFITTIDDASTVAQESVFARPERLSLVDVPGVGVPIAVTAGTVGFDGRNVVAQNIVLARPLTPGSTQLQGLASVTRIAYDLEYQTGELAANFKNLPLPGGVMLAGGEITGDLDYDQYQLPLANLKIATRGDFAGVGVESVLAEVSVVGVEPLGEPPARATNSAAAIQSDSISNAAAPPPAPGKFDSLDVALRVRQGTMLPNAIVGNTEPVALPPLAADLLVRLADANPYVELARIDADGAPGTVAGQGRLYLSQTRPDGSLKPAYAGLWLEAGGWPVQLSEAGQPVPLSAGVVVSGELGGDDGTTLTIDNLYGSLADVVLAGSGAYRVGDEIVLDENGNVIEPLSVSLSLTRSSERPGSFADMRPQAVLDERPGAGADTVLAFEGSSPDALSSGRAIVMGEQFGGGMIQGEIEAFLQVQGSPADGRFNGNGSLITRNLVIDTYDIGNVGGKLTTMLTKDKFTLETTDARLFDAEAKLDVQLPITPSSGQKRRPREGTISLDVIGLSVARLTQAAGAGATAATSQPTTSATQSTTAAASSTAPLDGTLDIRLTGTTKGSDFSTLAIKGTVTGEDLRTTDLKLADALSIEPVYEDGKLVAPVTLTQYTVGLGAESLELSVEFDPSTPELVTLRDINAARYPVTMSRDAMRQMAAVEAAGAALINITADELAIYAREADAAEGPVAQADIGLPTRSGAADDRGELADNDIALPVDLLGRLDLGVEVYAGDSLQRVETVADIELEMVASRNEIRIERLVGDLPGLGQIEGGGRFETSRMGGKSDLWVRSRFDLAAVTSAFRLPEGGSGLVDVLVKIAPAPGPRPKGELAIDISGKATEGRWKSARLDQFQISLIASREPYPDGTPPQGPLDFNAISTDRARLQFADGSLDFYLSYRDRTQFVGRNGGRLLEPDLNRVVVLSLTTDSLQLADATGFLVEEDNGELVESYPDLRGKLSLIFNGTYLVDRVPRVRGIEGALAAARETRLIGGTLDGRGSIEVREGSLASFNIIQRILEFARFVPGSDNDEIDITFAMEAGDMRIESLRFYVDGVAIQGGLVIRDIFNDRKPIEGFVVPLVDTEQIPVVGIFSEIFNAAQAQATTLKLSRTLDDPKIDLAVVGDTLGTLTGQ
ncbi:MAG: hypothetical protein AAGK78_00620, partial [Planctomycetota bacterium]